MNLIGITPIGSELHVQYADFKALTTLPKVDLTVYSSTTTNGPNQVTTVEITNPSNSIAFFIRVAMQGATGHEIWPIFFNDNFITLLPKESRNVTATYSYPDKATTIVELFNNISGGQ